MDELFKIFKVDTEEAAKISASPDQPHQHNFEELIIGLEGQLEHFIDFNTTVHDAPFVSFVTQRKVHRVIPKLKNGRCNLWVIRFKSEFIAETTFQLYASYHNLSTLELKSDACFNRMVTLCEIMYDEMQQDNPDLSVTRHLLNALFNMIESEKRKVTHQPNGWATTQNTTLLNFLKILEENYQRPEGVEFYAEKLFMSSRNLNLISKNIFNQTISELIETRKLIEAQNQLTHSDKNISEIGFDL